MVFNSYRYIIFRHETDIQPISIDGPSTECDLQALQLNINVGDVNEGERTRRQSLTATDKKKTSQYVYPPVFGTKSVTRSTVYTSFPIYVAVSWPTRFWRLNVYWEKANSIMSSSLAHK